MNRDEFDKLRSKVLSKVGLVNMSLRKKLSYEESLKVNDITNDEIELMGWKYNQDINQVKRVKYVSYKDIEEDHQEHEQESKSIEVITRDNDMLNGLISNYDAIMKMVDMFKSNGFSNDNINSNKSSSIVIELPFEEDKQYKASIRVNKVVYDKWKEFCKQHSEYTSKDLLSMAMKEYMDKYK